MRYITVDKLKPEMVLAKPILGNNCHILLNSGIAINDAYIEKLSQLNISGIYIEDELSKDIEIKDVVSNEIRNTAVKKIKEIFTQFNLRKFHSKEYKQIDKILKDIVNEILDNPTAVVNIVDLKQYDDYTFQHSVSVSILSLIIGAELGFSRNKLMSLGYASLFHDIGKMKIDNNIINKAGNLTADEFEEIKKHPEYGYEFAKKFFHSLHSSIPYAILQHHEKFDGSGYPQGRKANAITTNAKIIALCDVFDAMTSNRSYRKAMLPSEAIEYIMANAGIHFDFDYVAVFIKKVAAYPVGMTVKLSNGLLGLVIKNNSEYMMRPLVRIINDGNKEAYDIDLSEFEYANITIVEVAR